MADAGDGASSATGFDAGGESTAEAMESSSESFETAETELCSNNEAEQELYEPGYDASEYEQELTDYSYEEAETVETTEQRFNDKGEPVGDKPDVAESYYLKEGDSYYEDGLRTEVDWDTLAENSDEKGFDKDTPVESHTFEVGEIFSRYGSEKGRYATEIGTEYPKLSLPYDSSTHEYGEYEVCKPVECEKGKAAKNFGQEGEGTQYLFSKTMSDMINDGTIKRVK